MRGSCQNSALTLSLFKSNSQNIQVLEQLEKANRVIERTLRNHFVELINKTPV